MTKRWHDALDLDRRPDLVQVLGDLTPNPGQCDTDLDRSSCLRVAALAQAEAADVRAAAAHCEAIDLVGTPPERWRWDCYFSSAEQLVKHHGHREYAQAVSLCGASGPYLTACIQHLLSRLARVAPAADEDDAETWATVRATAAAIDAHWENTPIGPALVEGFWAMAVGMSMHSASSVSGDLVDHLPPAVLPHVRAAAAHRLISEGSPGDRDLEGWAAAVSAALKTRRGLEPRGSRHMDYRVPIPKWSRKQGQRAGMNMILYQGPAVRVVAEDAEVDMALCVLEAAARQDPLPAALLVQGRAHSDPRVQWTTARLLKEPE